MSFRGRGRGGPRGVASTKPSHASATSSPATEPESDSLRQLRTQYSTQLPLLKELFGAEWSDEDLLLVLADTNGDVETAVGRISEGHAQQFTLKTKKPRKESVAPTAAPTQPASTTAGRGGFVSSRGGRGGSESARGGRGGARGAIRGGRGGISGSAPRVNSAANQTNGNPTSTPKTFETASTSSSLPPPIPEVSAAVPAASTTSTPALKVPVWGPKKSAPAKEVEKPAPVETSTENSTTPANWGDIAQSSTAADETASTAATTGWGDETPAEKLSGEISADRPETPIAASKPKSKIIPTGSKISWASIARPAEVAKPTPAQTAPAAKIGTAPSTAAVAAPPIPALIPAASEISPATENQQQQETEAGVINLPETSSSTTAEQPAWATQAAADASSTAPTSSLDPWGTNSSAAAKAPSPAPLAHGEGWADVVTASNHEQQSAAPYAQQATQEAEAHLPPNDTNSAGPIEISDISNNSSGQTAETHQEKANSASAGPPGFPPKRAASSRPQSEAVVMPGSTADRPIGVQFGSLSLFDSQQNSPGFGQQEKSADQAQQIPQQSSQQQQQEIQPQQQFYSQQSAESQNSAFSQPQQNLFAQSNSFSRYPQQTGYGGYNQPQQAQQQANEDSSQSAAAGGYSAFKAEQNPSAYFQNSQQPQQTGNYNTFGQAQTGQAGSDYSQVYGQQDALRNMGFYDQYGQLSQQSQFQNPARSHSAQGEENSSTGVATPGISSGTPQPQQHQQQHHQPQQQQPFGMMPYYPYGYYPQAYQPQSYGQVPPNYNALQQQYSQNYYQPQQQSQQYGNVGGNNRYGQQQSAGQGAQSYRGGNNSAGGQQAQYGQQQGGYSGGYNQQQTQPQTQQQPQRERVYNSKDLDSRDFF